MSTAQQQLQQLWKRIDSDIKDTIEELMLFIDKTYHLNAFFLTVHKVTD